DDSYAQWRDVKMRFEKPQDITSIDVLFTTCSGVLSSSVSKMRNLSILRYRYMNNIVAFAQDFYNSKIKVLVLELVGPVMDNGIPDWIINSRLVQNINLTSSV